MLRIFIGYDPRQSVSYHVLEQSIITRSSTPVSITPLIIEQLPITRQGLTPFTFSRFLIPWLCNYEGWALFLDADIIVQDDIQKLFDLADDQYAMMVSKNIDIHDGMSMRFEWASVMLFNCGHETNKCLTPAFIQTADRLHTLNWCSDKEIGDLPREWNVLVGYDPKRDDAKLIHYTQGIPCFPETLDSDYVEQWHKEHKLVNSVVPWVTLMGNSVHSKLMDGKVVPKYKKECKDVA